MQAIVNKSFNKYKNESKYRSMFLAYCSNRVYFSKTMKNIRDKLEALYSRSEPSQKSAETNKPIRRELDRIFQHKQDVKYFPKSQVEKENQSISDIVHGSWINTYFGDIFRAEFEYPLCEPYGNLNLENIFTISGDIYHPVFEIKGPEHPQELLFIDTETTGLSGGTGTIAFMIGLGWVENQHFVVHQYFITQLSHEEGMLELIQKVLPNFRFIVSYNGKTFDIPLLNSRFVLNRMSLIFENVPHIDLLHYTRTLWRYSMENCKLKTVETDLLGLYREDDIPGELIPDVYFDYLRNRRVDRIERIFYHNRFDIITMLANLILVLKSYESHEPEENPMTDFAKGKLFTRKKDIERSLEHFQHVLNSRISDNRRQKTFLELAALHKRQGNFKEAVELWKSAIDPQFPFVLEPFEELAKYYEHHEKNLDEAVKITEQALRELPVHRQQGKTNLEHRLTRLKTKLSRKKS
ncbi:ribonuclease H-like domain-containing protein [bacterium]|nr:ribonuclease H-like domain-containing protein [bacterium]